MIRPYIELTPTGEAVMHIRKKTYVMTRRDLLLMMMMMIILPLVKNIPLYSSNEDLKDDLEKFLGMLTN